MADKFACQMLVMKNSGTMRDIGAVELVKYYLCSTVIDLQEKGGDVERDIFKPIVDDTEHIAMLPNGVYQVFVYGDLFYEDLTDIQTGEHDGEWIFEEKEVIVTPVYPEPKTLAVKVKKEYKQTDFLDLVGGELTDPPQSPAKHTGIHHVKKEDDEDDRRVG